MAITELPENARDVMITYKKTYYTGAYGEKKVKKTVTKRGFYLKIFNNFSVPDEWAMFNGVLLPHGFGGDTIKIKDVIKWEYCKD